jgi:hypothetical protein
MLLLGSFVHGAWVLLSLCPYRAICAVHGRGVELADGRRADPSDLGGVREGDRRGMVL